MVSGCVLGQLVGQRAIDGVRLNSTAGASRVKVPEGVEPVDMKRFYTLDTPRSYILATEDIVFPSGEWGWHPRITSRLGPHRLLEMPGSHEVLFTNPDGLADKIIEAGRLLRGVVLLRAGVEPGALRAGYLAHQRFEVYRANVAQMVSELGWELASGEW
jgi:hypothetical protein